MQTFINIYNRILHTGHSFYDISKEEGNKETDDDEILEWITGNISVSSLSFHQLHIILQYLYKCSLWESGKYVCVTSGYVHDWMWFYNYSLSEDQNKEKVLKLIKILRQSPNYRGIDYYGLIRISKLMHDEAIFDEAIYYEANLPTLERLILMYPKSIILSDYIIGERFMQSLRKKWISICILHYS
jgi:hypothetical protein